MAHFFHENGLSIEYCEEFYSREKADACFHQLQQLDFQVTHVVVRGRSYTPKRKIIAFGDQGLTYAFSGTCVPAQEWTPLLLELKSDVESQTGFHFNYVLINLYPDGQSGIGKHRDNEKDMDPDTPIASLSFGASRNIVFERKNVPSVTIPLQHGSLYVMHAPTNELFYHSIPSQPDVKEPRISLTFRYIKSAEVSRKRPREESTSENDSSLLNVKPQQFSLGYDVYASVQLFKKQLKLHIRRYKKSEKDEMLPTKEGIAMSPLTWYDFSSKIFDFNLIYYDASFIANNALLGSHTNGQLHLQQLDYMPSESYIMKKTCIQLNGIQLESLKDLVPTITDAIIENLLCEQLPAAIIRARRGSTRSQSGSEIEGFQQLQKCVETDLCQQMRKVFKCQGCLVDSFSQLNHDCICMNESQQFSQLGFSVVQLLEVENVAKSLCCVENRVLDDKNFFNRLCVQDYKNMLFSDKMDDV